MKIPTIFGANHKFYTFPSLFTQSSLLTKRFPRSSSLQTRSLHSGHKLELPVDRNKLWIPIYRLRSIVSLQVISRFKLILTGSFILGCPVATYKYLQDQVSSSLLYSFVGCTTFSLCSLIIFSWFSTKVVGVVSSS
ncbi:unnamed protein product [Schistosoma turkestanicum]|nr:unnamed protein product [Schistosoma turkestanicum]